MDRAVNAAGSRKPVNAENQVMVQRALAGEPTKALRLKVTGIADSLIRAATG